MGHEELGSFRDYSRVLYSRSHASASPVGRSLYGLDDLVEQRRNDLMNEVLSVATK